MLNLTYTVLFIPETLTIPEIHGVQLQEEEEEEEETPKEQANILKRTIGKVAGGVGVVFSPLWHLRPTKVEETGKWNPRLLLFAVGLFIYSVGTLYVGQIVVLYGSNNLGFGVKDVSA